MRKRWKELLAVFAVLLVGIVVVTFRPEPEPVYEGKKLSDWIEIFRPWDMGDSWNYSKPWDWNIKRNNQKREAREHARYAIRKIGTNAFPCLLSWVTYEPSPWRRAIQFFLANSQHDRVRNAQVVFRLLGPTAEPAIPRLLEIINRNAPGKPREQAIFALAAIGPEANAALKGILSKPEYVGSDFETICLEMMGTNANILQHPTPPPRPGYSSTTGETATNLAPPRPITRNQ